MYSQMKKIVVVGSPGAGKTTLAQRLGNQLDIKVTHLDRVFWESDWKEKSREERIKIQHDLVQGDKWIIEGTYLDSSDERLQAADTIIFLDIPRLLCLQRAVKRRIEYHDKPRPDLPEGCREKLRILYILKVLVFPQKGRRLFLKKIKEIEGKQLQTENKTQFYWLKCNEDIEDFFEGKAAPQAVQLGSFGNQQKSALLPKLTLAVAFLGYLGIIVGTVTSSLSFVIVHPVSFLKHRKQHQHSDMMR